MIKGITKELLEELYVNQELSTRDVAEKLNVGQTTIRRWLKKFNIDTRKGSESRNTSTYKEKQKILAERYKEEYKKVFINKCEYCGKDFEVDSHHKKKKYCSQECLDLARNKNEFRYTETGDKEYKNTYVCERCNKEYTFWSSRIYTRKYCDDCLSLHKSELYYDRIKTTCGYCGKEIEVIPSRFKENKYCYCDVKCMAKHYSEIYSGENSPTWTGGKRHYKGHWLRQAKLCRERDNHTCQICGKTEEENGKALDVHHIKLYKSFDNPEEANNLDNLISLCHSCHRFVHSNSNIDKIYIKE